MNISTFSWQTSELFVIYIIAYYLYEVNLHYKAKNEKNRPGIDPGPLVPKSDTLKYAARTNSTYWTDNPSIGHILFGIQNFLHCWCRLLSLSVFGTEAISSDEGSIYTMHNKFSNGFVWVSPPSSDLKFHLLSWRYNRRTSDKNFHYKVLVFCVFFFFIKKYRIAKRCGRAKVTLNFKTSG